MQIVRSLDEQFRSLHARSRALVAAVPAEKLYAQPEAPAGMAPAYSCGEYILRSAATVEQTFGGINSNLWDDPFEWTLPESLPTTAHVEVYLEEVEETRLKTFALFRSDEDLLKKIAVPSGEMRALLDLLFETLVRASHYQGRAFATLRLFSETRLPRV